MRNTKPLTVGRKWKYPDPSIKGEKWYDWPKDIPDDLELENYIYAILKRHHFYMVGGSGWVKDAALVPLLKKLFYIWSVRGDKIE